MITRPALPPGWRLECGNNYTKPNRCAIGPCEGKCFVATQSDADLATAAAWDFVLREECCGMEWVEYADYQKEKRDDAKRDIDSLRERLVDLSKQWRIREDGSSKFADEVDALLSEKRRGCQICDEEVFEGIIGLTSAESPWAEIEQISPHLEREIVMDSLVRLQRSGTIVRTSQGYGLPRYASGWEVIDSICAARAVSLNEIVRARFEGMAMVARQLNWQGDDDPVEHAAVRWKELIDAEAENDRLAAEIDFLRNRVSVESHDIERAAIVDATVWRYILARGWTVGHRYKTADAVDVIVACLNGEPIAPLAEHEGNVCSGNSIAYIVRDHARSVGRSSWEILAEIAHSGG